MSKLERTNVHLLNTHGGNRGGVNVFLVSQFQHISCCSLHKVLGHDLQYGGCAEPEGTCWTLFTLLLHSHLARLSGTTNGLKVQQQLCKLRLPEHHRRPALHGRRGRLASEPGGMLQRARLAGQSGAQPMQWPQVRLPGLGERSLARNPEGPKQTQPLLLHEQLAGVVTSSGFCEFGSCQRLYHSCNATVR